MTRREFVAVLGVAAVWPLAARAQQTVMPAIGFLGSESPALFASHLRMFSQGLSETGYVEGRNVAIEYRWAEGQNDRLPALVDDLVRRQVRVIATPGTTPGALAAKAATTTIPIVFFTAGDPVTLKLLTSLNRLAATSRARLPWAATLRRSAWNCCTNSCPPRQTSPCSSTPSNPLLAESTSRRLQETARSLGLRLHTLRAGTERDFDSVFAELILERPLERMNTPVSLGRFARPNPA